MARRSVTIGWFIIFILLIYGVIVGIRLAKIYINDYHLRGIIKQETRFSYVSETELVKKIIRKAQRSNIPLEKNDLSIVEKNDNRVVFRVVYSRLLDGIFFKYDWNFDYLLQVKSF